MLATDMPRRPLGNTGFMVSPIAFGALTIGPVHKNMSVSEGAAVIRAGLEEGINLIDTAQCYETYPYIREAIKGWQDHVYITTKSYAWNRLLMAEAFEEARQELDRDKLDIFLLHEQESGLTIQGHYEALEFLLAEKAKGNLGAVGISTHAVAAVIAAADMPEIDVIHPIINIYGHGIIDGTRDDMLRAISYAASKGKGLYGMKALAGGKLSEEAQQCFRWAFGIKELSSFAVGMKSLAEVYINTAWVKGMEAPKEYVEAYVAENRHITVGENCSGCGSCVKRCGQRAISLLPQTNKAYIEEKKCVLCGYCRDNCRESAINIF
ncbi:MAG: aldo/keto reductase [Bacillota bacterium]|nr:aldo/keto reductase [Bacillota bacterium]